MAQRPRTRDIHGYETEEGLMFDLTETIEIEASNFAEINNWPLKVNILNKRGSPSGSTGCVPTALKYPQKP
jgi:hypothetical protein